MGGPTENGSKKIKTKEKIETIDPRCVVRFRPNDDWEGEYGFDWYREADTEEHIDNSSGTFLDYDNDSIVGKYSPKDPDDDEYNNTDNDFQSDNTQIKKLRDEYSPLFIGKPPHRPGLNDPMYFIPFISLFFKSVNKEKKQLPNKMVEKRDDKYCILNHCITEAKIIALIEGTNLDKIKKIVIVYEKCISVVTSGCLNSGIVSSIPIIENYDFIIILPSHPSSTFQNEEKRVITIKLNYDFKEEYKSIKAYAVDNNDKVTFAGQINVVRCVPKTVKVCFVNVIHKIPGSRTLKSGLSNCDDQKLWLKRFLSQAHIIPDITVAVLEEGTHPETERYKKYTLDLSNYWTKDGNADVFRKGNGRLIAKSGGKCDNDENNMIGNILKKAFDEKYHNFPDAKDKSYKVFFLGELGVSEIISYRVGDPNCSPIVGRTKIEKLKGYASGTGVTIKNGYCVLFGDAKGSNICHELLHCFGLTHSFSNMSKHTFQKISTNNIMDYSDKTYTLWRWQWEKIRNADGVTEINTRSLTAKRKRTADGVHQINDGLVDIL